MTKYTVDYFIEKFQAIPSNLWTTDVFHDSLGRSCAYGHCGSNNTRMTEEAKSLQKIFEFGMVLEPEYYYVSAAVPAENVFRVNDGHCTKYKQKTPKARILAALKDIKKGVK